MKLYILLGVGFGNNESAFEPLGVFSSRTLANQARAKLITDAVAAGVDEELEFRIDETVLDDCAAGF